jgi:hypothetical protein
VVSAFESVDRATLEILDKGHTVGDMVRAIELVRGAGIHIRPTWLPFLPWTSVDDVASVFEFIDAHKLVGATDPVQMAIKLLIPKGSLLETHPAVTPYLEHYDTEALTWRWRFADQGADMLQKELESIAAKASDCGQETATTMGEMRETVSKTLGEPMPEPTGGIELAPRLTESWFCCAEPTNNQLISIRRS